MNKASTPAAKVDCPHCSAKAGEPCLWPETRETNRDHPHKAREALAATQAQSSGKASEPFLYAIMGPDGAAHLDEQCVSSVRGDLDDTVFSLNDEHVSGPYRVVELFVPVHVVRQAFDHIADASKMVAADLSDADGWIACADRLPDLDVPVFGVSPGSGIAVYTRTDSGEGWLWSRQNRNWSLTDPDGFECDDDYEVTHWRPMVALPEEPK